jgi:deoxyribonuclease V
MPHRPDLEFLSTVEARAVQDKLAGRVIEQALSKPITTVAGVDVALGQDTAWAAVAVLDFPGLELQEWAWAARPLTFPYVPGLLTFREGPVILEAVKKLSAQPDLFVFDGQGRAHPRRLGIASHMGLLLDRPSIGCAKSRLCGLFQDPGPERGSYTFLEDHGEKIGAAVRTRRGVKPVFVSVGHRIDLQTSIEFVLACSKKYRLPETTRWAHRLAGEAKSRKRG